MTAPRLFRRVLLAIVALGFVACQADRTPVGPRDAAPSIVTINGVKLLTATPQGRITIASGDLQEKLVKAQDGATISSSDAKLIVPAGAVAGSTVITMQPLNNGFVEFRFGPSGLQFLSPATLEIKTKSANLLGIDLSRLAIAGASDTGDDWTLLGDVYDPLTGVVRVPITHFSRYALCVE